MAQTQVEIEVELSGAGKVDKGIKKIEGGLEGIGETGSRLAKAMGSTNEKLGEGLENVSGTVGEVREAFSSLKDSVSLLGKNGPSAILNFIGPLGMLVGAGIAVYETFRQISGAAQEAEEAQEAMAAAAGDLQSRFESLAESGVILAKKEMVAFSVAVLEAQFLKEQVQKKQEKFARGFDAIRKAIEKVDKATEHLNFVQSTYRKDSETLSKALLDLKEAENDLKHQRRLAEIGVSKLNQMTQRYLHSIEKLTEVQEKARKQTTENLKKEALRLAGLEKENDTLRFTNELRSDQVQLNEMLTSVNTRHIELTKELEDADRKKTIQILNSLKEIVGETDEVTIQERKAAQEREKIRKDEAKSRREERKKRSQDFKRLREQELKKDLVLTSQIRQAEIKLLFEKDEQVLELEKERHRATLELTKAGSKERELEEKRHQLAIQLIKQNRLKEDKRKEDEGLQILQESNERELNLRYDLARRLLEIEQEPSGFGTDMESLIFESEQRLKILELEFQREINLAKMKGQEITEIQRRFAVERLAITKESTRDQAELLSEYFAEYSEGFAQAGFNALFFGESFQEATAQVLKSLAQQAVSQSVMKAAEGFGLLAMGLPGSAMAFKSSALFASAAAIAGVASNALGGGGGGAAQPGTSPTGQPSTAPTPEREERTTDSMVFNINFGGAVVYDTKKAAEQAFADRLVSIINTPRRGAVQFNRR